MTTNKPRYRLENDRPCVDVSIPSIDRIFDTRDPAPFRQRDLDPDLVTYLVGASEDLSAQASLNVVFWLEQPCAPNEIELAFRAHFEDEIERLTRRRRVQRRVGSIALAVAVVAIGLLLSLAGTVGDLVGGRFGHALREALVISSWVLMWRPIDTLVYDGIPFRHERQTMRRLLAAVVDVRSGKPPGPAPST